MQSIAVTCDRGDELFHRTKPRQRVPFDCDIYYSCDFCDRNGDIKKEDFMPARSLTLTATLIAVPTATPQNFKKLPNLAMRLKSLKTPSQSSFHRKLVLSLKTKSMKTRYLLLS